MPQQILEDIDSGKKFLQSEDGSLQEVEEIGVSKSKKSQSLTDIISNFSIPNPFKLRHPALVEQELKNPSINIGTQAITRPILQGLGSLGGGIIGLQGGPLSGITGSGAGFVGGSAVDEFLRTKFPQLFGEPTGSYFPSGTEQAINTGADILGLGIPPLRQAIKSKLLSSISKKLPEETIAALDALKAEGITSPQMTVGTPGGIPRYMEDILAPAAKEQRIAENLRDIRAGIKESTGLITEQVPQSFSKEAIAKSKITLNAEKTIENKAWDSLRESLPQREINKIEAPGEISKILDPITGKPTLGPPKIKKLVKPFIDIPNTVQAALKHKETIDELFASEAGDVTTNRLKRQFAELRDTINTILTPIKTWEPVLQGEVEIPIKEFDNIRRIKSSINRLNAGSLRKTEANAALQDISNAINKDFQEQLPADTFAKYEKANEATKTFYKKFPQEIQDALVGKESEFFDKILKDPENLDAFIKGSGKEEAKKEVLTQILNRSMSEKTPGVLDIPKVLNALEGRGGEKERQMKLLLDKVLTSDERNRIKNVFTVANSIDPELAMAGRVAFGIRAGGMVINITSGLLTGLATGSIPAGVTTGGVGIALFLEAKDFTKKVLLNPEIAQATVRGLKAPLGSKEAIESTRKVWKVLKGSQVVIMRRNKDGSLEEAGEVELR